MVITVFLNCVRVGRFSPGRMTLVARVSGFIVIVVPCSLTSVNVLIKLSSCLNFGSPFVVSSGRGRCRRSTGAFGGSAWCGGMVRMSSRFARDSSFLGRAGVVGSCVFVLLIGVIDGLRAVVGVGVMALVSLFLSGGPESVKVASCVSWVVG